MYMLYSCEYEGGSSRKGEVPHPPSGPPPHAGAAQTRAALPASNECSTGTYVGHVSDMSRTCPGHVQRRTSAARAPRGGSLFTARGCEGEGAQRGTLRREGGRAAASHARTQHRAEVMGDGAQQVQRRRQLQPRGEPRVLVALFS